MTQIDTRYLLEYEYRVPGEDEIRWYGWQGEHRTRGAADRAVDSLRRYLGLDVEVNARRPTRPRCTTGRYRLVEREISVRDTVIEEHAI